MSEKEDQFKTRRLDPFRLQVGEAIIYVDQRLGQDISTQALSQVYEAGRLPGSKVVVMPDIHVGYGLPIGGVLASRELISAEAVGVDINCGVSLSTLDVKGEELESQLRPLLKAIMKQVPAGVGKGNPFLRDRYDYRQGLLGVLLKGAAFIIEELGLGDRDELSAIEDQGQLKVDEGVAKNLLSHLSAREIKKHWLQLGTLGSGNHFIEFQLPETIYAAEKAEAFGIQASRPLLMLHTGSRGLGNNIAQHYIKSFKKSASKYQMKKYKLTALPADSEEAREYMSAMNAMANYAFANRQLIRYLLRQVLEKRLGSGLKIKTVYDLAHNIVKLEKHQGKDYYLHRKGATRAFPPGHPELTRPDFRALGQPALIPGSMGTPSYLVTGTQKALEETFGTVSHGSGRVMSRRQARRELNKKEFKRFRRENYVFSGSGDNLLDEAPEAYKASADIIHILEGAGLIEPVVSLRPLGTIKG